jgi:WD40 repeat protein
LAGHAGLIKSAGFAADGKRVVTASTDRTARTWATWDRAIDGVAGSVDQLSFSPDGRWLAIATMEGGTWVAPTAPEIQAVGEPERPPLRSLAPATAFRTAFNPTRPLLAIAGEDGAGAKVIELWEVGTWKRLGTLKSQSWVGDISFSADGRFLAAARNDGSMTIWNMDDLNGAGKTGRTLPAEGSALLAAAFGGAGQLMAIGKSGLLAHWTIQPGPSTPASRVRFFASAVKSAAFSPDGAVLVATVAGAKPDTSVVVVMDARTRVRVATLDVGPKAKGLVFSPDGALFATGGERDLVVWDTRSWTPIVQIDEPKTEAAAFDRGNATLAIARSGRVTLYGRAMFAPTAELQQLAEERLGQRGLPQPGQPVPQRCSP